MPNAKKPVVFVSYSHKDTKWLEELRPHFKALDRAGKIQYWDDKRLRQGDDWFDEIRTALADTRYAILLVSNHFLTSSFVLEEEVPYLLTQKYKGKLEILPIIVEDCLWEAFDWLARIQNVRVNGDPDKAFLQCARRVLASVKSGEALHPPRQSEFDPPKKVDVHRLPETGSTMFGRNERIKNLYEWWDDPNTNIVALKADGGVGKSTLVRVWTEQMAEDNYRGAKAVFAWSFYSQGTDKASSADQFINDALRFFGVKDPEKGSPWDRGDRLADLVQAHRTLLLLDGMEPLQSGHDFDRGAIKDPALKVLVERLAERNPGLCVISTRENVREFRERDFEFRAAVQEVDLEKVSAVAGRALLRIGGVPGTDDEIEALVENFGHHALALNLLAAYLKWPDARAVSDIPELDDIPEEEGRHARRVMAAFETLFGEGPQLDLLRILGLFDGPVEQTVIRALLARPPIEGLTDHLTRGGARAFADAQATLRRAKLLEGESVHDPPRLDSHPLVREHFGEPLERERPEAWRAGHERLFEHYQEVAEYQPSTLEGLAPLYAAVAHGCAAGRYQEALEEVLSSFFSTRWSKVGARLPESDQAWLFNAAGFCLRALGRLRVAAEPMEAALRVAAGREDWRNASAAAGNLAGLQLTRGEVGAAVQFGRRAVEYADRSDDGFERLSMRTAQADAEHQAGRPKAAETLFREAERLQQERQPDSPLLYSMQGFVYCDLLLAQGRPAEAQRRATQTLEWARAAGLSLLTIALDHLTLGRAALALGDLPEAAERLDEAVNGLRASGNTDDVPRSLLARAELHRRQGHFERARRDLREVEKITRRGEMRLHLTDFHLESARLALAESDPAAAREHLAKARQLVNETGYHRRDPDLDEIVLKATKGAQHLTSRSKLDATSGRQTPPRDTELKEDRMDWIGALGEMGKGLPGGQIVLGPLLKLRDEEARRRFNESIDERFKTGQEISEGILDQLAEHQERTRSLDASTEVMKTLLEEIASAVREQRPRRAPMAVVTSAMKISRFPLPFGRELLFAELAELFQDEDDLEDLEECLLAAGLKGLDGRGRVAKLKRFLSRLTGQPRRKLEKLFCCLYTQREGSEILRHACEFWRRDGKRPQSSGGPDASAGEQ